MAIYPPGVQLAQLSIGPVTDMFGDLATLTVSVTPVFTGGVTHITHTASGHSVAASTKQFISDSTTGVVQFAVPATNETGWQDPSGRVIDVSLTPGWSYLLKVNATIGRQAVGSWTKEVQPLVEQTGEIDVDLVGGENILEGVLGPTAVVTSIAGRVGTITVADLEAMGVGATGNLQIGTVLEGETTSATITTDAEGNKFLNLTMVPGIGEKGDQGDPGPSAYQHWLNLGNTGTEQDFINAITGTDGVDGTDGQDAYQLWLQLGNTGTEQDFLDSLVGPAGSDGTDGTNGSDGVDGRSAYQVWLDQGNTGTVSDYLEALRGPQGLKGDTGDTGPMGSGLEITGSVATRADLDTLDPAPVKDDAYVALDTGLLYIYDGTDWSSGIPFKGDPGADADTSKLLERARYVREEETYTGQRIAPVTYFYPDYFAASSQWGMVRDSVPTSRWVLINPASGPGEAANTDYQAQTVRSQAGGLRALGYISTVWGMVPLATLQDQTTKHVNWYGVDGIFLDEATTGYEASTTLHQPYIDYYAWVKETYPDLIITINPGMAAAPKMLDVCDMAMSYENTGQAFLDATDLDITPNHYLTHPRNKFWVALHSVTDLAQAEAIVAKLKAHHVGHVYLTDKPLDPNPWDRLPVDWLWELQTMEFAAGGRGPQGEPGADGESAYQTWLAAGNSGTEADFLLSLEGAPGADGADGSSGADGDSAYQVWLAAGNSGTQQQFLDSLKGADGIDGTNGSDGADGDSAYQIWLNAGNSGTEADFLASLEGAPGADGADGADGTNASLPHTPFTVRHDGSAWEFTSLAEAQAGGLLLEQTIWFISPTGTAAPAWARTGDIWMEV